MNFLHVDCGIAHQDIRGSNILIYESTESHTLSAKVADFGLATSLENIDQWASTTKFRSAGLKSGSPEIRRLLTERDDSFDVTSSSSAREPEDHITFESELISGAGVSAAYSVSCSLFWYSGVKGYRLSELPLRQPRTT